MPAFVGYGVDMPYVPLVPRGRHEGFIVVAARPRPVDALHLALSGYLAVVFVSRAAPAPVSRRCGGGNGFRNGGGVIVIALGLRKQKDVLIAAARSVPHTFGHGVVLLPNNRAAQIPPVRAQGKG